MDSMLGSTCDGGERSRFPASPTRIHRFGGDSGRLPHPGIMFCVESVASVPNRFAGGRHHAAKTPRFHPDRTAGGDRHHRRSDRPALARRAGGPRGRPPAAVREQSRSRWRSGSTTTCRSRTRCRRCSRIGACPMLLRPRSLAIPGHWPLGWAVGLLPFIEQTALYNSANYSPGSPDPTNFNTLSAVKVNAYICPSESQRNGPVWGSTFMNYKANIGGPAQIMAWSGPIVIMRTDGQGRSLAYENSGNVGYGRVRVDHGRDEQFGRLQREAHRDQRGSQCTDK